MRVCVCVYLAERVSFVRVEASLHAHARLPLQLPEHQPTRVTLHCSTRVSNTSRTSQSLKVFLITGF